MKFILIAALLLTLGVIPAVTAAERPNILFFLVDDMGVADTSVPFLYDKEGKPVEVPFNARYRTPNMEKLAAQGRKFTNAHAYPVCTPTRVSLMTGIAAPRMHVTTWTDPQVTRDTDFQVKNGVGPPKWHMQGIDLSLPTLPRILQQAGYRTIHCGKAHFGPEDTAAADPLSLGFDVNIAGYGGGGPGSYWGDKNFSAAWRGGGHQWDIPGLDKYHGKDIFLTEALTLEMDDQLEQSVAAKKPFFAYMSHYAVHAPFETDSRFAANYPKLTGKDLAFATMVEGMDKSLGDLIAKLDALGVAEDTLVVFYSDNGSEGPQNAPLRGRKGSRWEGGIRVPMIVAWAKPNPANPLQQKLPIPAGSIDNTLVQPTDFLLTIAAITGTKLPAGDVIDGHDLSADFIGSRGTHQPQTFLAHFPHSRDSDAYFTAFIDGDWKITYGYADKNWQLTHLTADIGEKDNLVAKKPAAALIMAKRMIAALKAENAQYPVAPTTGALVLPDLTPLQSAAKAAETKPRKFR